MKFSCHLRLIALLPVAALFITSCSKDAVDSPQNSGVNRNTTSLAVDVPPADVEEYGTIQLTVLPIESKSAVTIFNEYYTSDEIFSMDTEGVVTHHKLRTGTYSIRIHPYNPNYDEIVIEDVTVNADDVTDLGVIEL